MNVSNDLFKLIKSLSKSEKRYFKIHSTLHTIGKRNKYLDLFDIIEKQKEYNEDKIKKKFEKELFIRQFNVAKKYLYEMILKSSQQYSKSINSNLRDRLNEVEFLLEKRLFIQCEKLLSKARQTAEKHEKYTILMDISSLENQLLTSQSYTTKTNENMNEIFKEEISVIKKQQNISEYRNLTNTMYLYYSKKGNTLQQTDLEFYQNILAHPLFSSENKALSFQAKKLYYQAYMLYHGSIYLNKQKHLTKAYSYSQKVVQLYESTPAFIEENNNGYRNAYHNLIASAVRKKKYAEAQNIVEKLKAMESKSSYKEYKEFFFTNNVLLVLAINKGEFEKGVELISSIQKEIIKKDLKNILPEDQIVFNYCFATIYFGAEQYSKAKIYLNKIINDAFNLRNDLYGFSKFMLILIHYELGNESLLESAIRSAYRYLYKRKRI